MNRQINIRTNEKIFDVVLVKLPYTSILHTPSLGLGILKSANEKIGIKTHIIESEIDFATLVGEKLFSDLVWPNTEALFFDALFSTLIFSDNKVTARYYLEKFKNIPLSGPRLKIAQSYEIFQSVKSKGEFLFVLFNYLQPLCEKLINNVAQEIVSLNPKILGSTSTTEQTLASVALFKRIKHLSPNIITVLGGFNCEGFAGKALVKKFEVIDVVFSGESEIEFPIFCKKVLQSGLESYLFEKPNNTWNKKNAFLDKYETGMIRLSLDSIDNSPAPNFTDFINRLFEKNSFALTNVVLPFVSSRGCWWGEKHHCTFCGLNDHTLKFKAKNPEKIYSEVVKLYNDYGVRSFVAADLVLPQNYIKTFVAKLESNYPNFFSIYYQVKSNLTLEEISSLKNAGINNVQPGIESFDDEELESVNKGVTGIQNIAFLKYCAMNEMTVAWNVIYDRRSTSNKKLRDLLELLPSLFHFFPPTSIRPINYPRDSVFYLNRGTNGMDLRAHSSYREVYRFKAEDEEDFAYLFVDHSLSKNKIDPNVVISLNNISEKWKKMFNDKGTCAKLFYHVDFNGFVKVVDTRSGVKYEYVFENYFLELFDMCLSPIQTKVVVDKILLKKNEFQIFDEKTILDLINYLVEKRLFYRANHKIINLMIKNL